MHPTRCLSSHLTTELLTFRNPQGGEENWLNGNQTIAHDSIFKAKIITAEIGVALLCVTATVECIAYMILGMGLMCTLILTIPLRYITERPYLLCIAFDQKLRQLGLSSGFTIYWNFGNLLIFNIFCTNVFTQESLARYSIDHLPRGEVYKTILVVMDFALKILAIMSKTHYEPITSSRLWKKPCLRPEDIVYIADWSRTHRTLNQHQIGLLNPQTQQLVNAVQGVEQSIDEGTAYLKECILDPGQIDDDTRKQVLEFDPDVYLFVLTRSIYIYVFGSKRDDAIPSFFKLETRNLIDGLRDKYEKDKGAPLEALMQDLVSFNDDQADEEIKKVLNEIKGAAHGELQNSLFLTKCWQRACAEFEQNSLQNENPSNAD